MCPFSEKFFNYLTSEQLPTVTAAGGRSRAQFLRRPVRAPARTTRSSCLGVRTRCMTPAARTRRFSSKRICILEAASRGNARRKISPSQRDTFERESVLLRAARRLSCDVGPWTNFVDSLKRMLKYFMRASLPARVAQRLRNDRRTSTGTNWNRYASGVDTFVRGTSGLRVLVALTLSLPSHCFFQFEYSMVW